MNDQQLLLVLREAQEKLREQDDFLKKLTEPPLQLGSFIRDIEAKDNKEKMCLVTTGGGLMEVYRTENKLTAGDAVLFAKTGQIAKVRKGSDYASGGIFMVAKALKGRAEISAGAEGNNFIVWTDIEVHDGDRVLLDQGRHVVVENLGPDEGIPTFDEESGICWDDIGGQIEAKLALQDAVEMPYKNPGLFKAYNKALTKGVLLYGPPGCGKTMLGKAVATALAKLHGLAKSRGFFYIKAPEILDKYVGESESKIRRLFMSCRQHKAKHGYPAVLFIDEADAILGYRGGNNNFALANTIVPQFLAEMDGMSDSGAMVLLATNRPDVLDPAVVRDGRIDRRVEITRPNQTDVQDIFDINLKRKPLSKGLTTKDASRMAAHHFFEIGLGVIGSGAMVAGIVEQASSMAIHRDIERGGKPQGISEIEIHAAISRARGENKNIAHQSMPEQHAKAPAWGA